MRKTEKLIIFLSLFVFFCANVNAQDEEEQKEKIPLLDRLYFGGNVGLQFGDITFIDVSPQVGYRVTEKFSAGVGGTYRYINNKIFFPPFETNVLGYRIFARYDVTPVVYPYAEYENLSLRIGNETNREWFDAFFIGAGFFQPIGRRGGINILALYNLNYTAITSLYNTPWVFRVGFQF
ncbi:MAG: hypothetical protein AAGI07_17785 [Bacteroidota bacterium]